MASEQVLEVLVRRHVLDSERPFASVLDGIFGGISRPDTGLLFGQLAASTSYEQFSSLVRQAQGSAGLIRFLHLDLDAALTLDPQAQDQAGRRLVRLIAGNPRHHGRDDPPRGRRRLVRAGHHPHPGTARRQNPRRLRRSSARSPPTTTRPRRTSPSGSTPRCSNCCAR